jgi:cytochrome b561
MAGPAHPSKYHWSLVALHWGVAALVVVQYLTGSSIERVHHAEAHGHAPSDLDVVLHHIHNRVGLAILVLVVGRIVLRVCLGAPEPVRSRSVLGEAFGRLRARLSGWMHAALYGALIGQATSGAIASYLFWPVSSIHSALASVTLALVAGHVGAALWHNFVEADGILYRMMLGKRSPPGTAPATSQTQH